MRRIPYLREYARRLTKALRTIWQSLEKRVEQIILEGCPFSPDKIAASVTSALIAWEFQHEVQS